MMLTIWSYRLYDILKPQGAYGNNTSDDISSVKPTGDVSETELFETDRKACELHSNDSECIYTPDNNSEQW